MLPDFSEFKAELDKVILARLRKAINSKDPVLSSIRSFTQHEGRLMRYEQRPSGDTVEEGFDKVSVDFTISASEVPTFFGPNLDRKLNEVADKAVRQMAQSFFKKIEETSKQAGTTTDAKGQPLTPQLLLETMDKAQVEFDAAGNPTTTLVVHPNMVQALKKLNEQIESDPELKRQYEQSLRQQRAAWAAREDNRKLVD